MIPYAIIFLGNIFFDLLFGDPSHRRLMAAHEKTNASSDGKQGAERS